MFVEDNVCFGVWPRHYYFNYLYEFCKIEVRHTLKRKNCFDFFFSNSKLLCNKQLGDYLRKLKRRFS